MFELFSELEVPVKIEIEYFDLTLPGLKTRGFLIE